MTKTFEQLVPAPAAFDGITRPYSPAEVERLRARCRSPIRWPSAAPIGCGNR